MATLSNELFLYVCVKHANGGKINFVEVAKECSIKSGAASMRWSRFVKKLDTSSLANSGAILGESNEEKGTNGEDTPKKTPKKSTAKKTTPKKRKLNGDGDDDDKDEKIKLEDE